MTGEVAVGNEWLWRGVTTVLRSVGNTTRNEMNFSLKP